jgi:hypothetical protein
MTGGIRIRSFKVIIETLDSNNSVFKATITDGANYFCHGYGKSTRDAIARAWDNHGAKINGSPCPKSYMDNMKKLYGG